jgi:hypothetical protein
MKGPSPLPVQSKYPFFGEEEIGYINGRSFGALVIDLLVVVLVD